MKFLLFLYILGACLSVLTHADETSEKRYYCNSRRLQCFEYNGWSLITPILYSSIEACRQNCPWY
ncbi:unnamed protein product [Cylicocyclus nassatus]|uniref:Uncharacterized protein n=1 Tax=Cylicocyclus nassatus TaxID=53992 RepID=A0AA36H1B4_CYLNA|nr:unnamed protein product [Cylicocyclus nassatus]